MSSTDNKNPTRQTIIMTKLLLSFLVESDKTFTFFLDRKRQPLLSPLHQGFLLPGSMVMIPSFFKEFGEPPYQRPHCPPHLLYCILSILTPPSSVRLFIKIGPLYVHPFCNLPIQTAFMNTSHLHGKVHVSPIVVMVCSVELED